MKQPVTCFFGGNFTADQKIQLAKTMTPYFFADDSQIDDIRREIEPQVIASIGMKCGDFPHLFNLPSRDRQKWLHYKDTGELMKKIDGIYHCFVNHSIKFHNDKELVSVFTTSYNSGEMIQRPFKSLLNQTYKHWEWVIMCDSNGDENFRNLVRLREQDPSRIRVYRPEKNSGVIGNVKQLAASLCRGGYIVEMDHDDELQPTALEHLVQAGKKYPDAGFFYSDFTEIYENGDNFCYGDHFGLGYGAYRKIFDKKYNKWVNYCASLPINGMTIRYLVGCPNHYRAWRMSTFKEIGGWNPNFHVADDYEILVRTFLHTKMVRIPHPSYYQYRNKGGNHTFIRNAEIQKLWRTMSNYYNPQIAERMLELTGEEDPFINNWWNHSQLTRYWWHSNYEKPLNYLFPIKEKNPKKLPLISFISSFDSNYITEIDEIGKTREKQSLISLLTNREQLRHLIKNVTNQTYSNLEIMITGNSGEIIGPCMDNLLINKPENQIFNIARIKQDVFWWNFKHPQNNLTSLLNFGPKLIAQGSLMFLVDAKNLLSLVDENLTQLIAQSFIDDDELQYVTIKNTDHLIFRTSLHHQYGYWHEEKDLFLQWQNEKSLEIVLNIDEKKI